MIMTRMAMVGDDDDGGKGRRGNKKYKKYKNYTRGERKEIRNHTLNHKHKLHVALPSLSMIHSSFWFLTLRQQRVSERDV